MPNQTVPARIARSFALFVCVESAHSLLSALLVQKKVLKNTLFLSALLRGKTIAALLMGPFSEIGEKLFFCIADKRKGEIDHLNYSLASDLSSFKGCGGVEGTVIAAYFPLCKHPNFSPGSLKLLKPFDKSFSPSDMVVKWLCAWDFIPL